VLPSRRTEPPRRITHSAARRSRGSARSVGAATARQNTLRATRIANRDRAQRRRWLVDSFMGFVWQWDRRAFISDHQAGIEYTGIDDQHASAVAPYPFGGTSLGARDRTRCSPGSTYTNAASLVQYPKPNCFGDSLRSPRDIPP